MSVRTKFFRQFGRPTGFMGGLVGHIMARKSENLERGRWTIDLLELTPSDGATIATTSRS